LVNGPLRRALRSETPCRLLRRETLPTVGRGERSAADEAREGETLRLRIRAEGYGSRAHGLRASQGLQKSEGDRASQKGGVRRNDAPPRGRSLPERRQDSLGGRQPQSTHIAAAFYESFPPEQARHLVKKIEFVYTPVHGSWLNMVEIELRPGQAVPEGTHPGHRDSRVGSGSLVRGAKPAGYQVRLALHHRRWPHKAAQALSIN
jgi:hypothetical protein